MENKSETQSKSKLTFRVLTLMFCVTLILLPTYAQAQNSDRERIMEELIKDLVNNGMGEFGQDDTGIFNNQDSNATKRAPRESDQQTIREIYNFARDFSNEAYQLAKILNNAQYSESSVKSHFNEALKVTASARVLERTAREAKRLSSVIPAVERLDREWRLLNRQLYSYASYNRNVKRSVDKLNGLDDKLIRLAESRPQLDMKTIIRECHSIEYGLEKLLEDIRYELPGSQAKNDLVYDGNQIKHEVSEAIEMIYQKAEHNELARLYKSFQDSWYPYAAKLRNYRNVRIDRRVQDIQNSNTKLKELFLLPQEIDRQQLVYLTDKLVTDVDYFFARTPLKLIIELRDAESALATANEFYGVFENFAGEVNGGGNISDLIDAFSYIEESWDDFNHTFDDINSSKAKMALQRIEHSMSSLRNSLQVENKYDQTKAINLAAKIDNLVNHLNYDVRIWLDKDRNFTYRAETLRDSEQFAKEAERFDRAVVSGQSLSQLRNQFNSLYNQWRKVYRNISKCRTAHRPHLGRQASKITPTMVEMRTLLNK